MSDFSLDIDSSKLVQALKSLDDFGGGWTKMVSRVVSENSRLQKALKADDATIELAKQMYAEDVAQKRRLDSIRMVANAKRGLAQEQRKEEAATRKVNIETKKLVAEKTRLTQKYNTTAAASIQYSNAQKEIRRATHLGIISIDQQNAALGRLTREYNSFKSGTAGWSNQFVQGAERGGRSVNRFGMYAQQVGYQVGDFFVQVQSGQNVMVAFAQQGTQLAGLLPGLSGAVVGIGLSFAGMVYQMARGINTTSGMTSEVDRLAEAAKEASEEIGNLEEAIRLYNSGFSNTSELSLGDDIAKQELILADLERALVSAQEEAGNLDERLSTMGANPATIPTIDRIAASNVEIAKVARDAAVSKLAYLVDLQREVSLNEQIKVLREKQVQDSLVNNAAARESLRLQIQDNSLKGVANTYGEQSLEYLNAQQAIQRSVLEKKILEEQITKGVADGLRKALETAQSFEALDMGKAIRNASLDTDGLITRLENAVRLASDIAKASAAATSISDGSFQNELNNNADADSRAASYRTYGASRDNAPSAPPPTTDLYSTNKPSTNSGGSGRAKAERDDFIESLNKEMAQRRTLNGLFGDQRVLQEEIFRIEKGLGESRSEYSKEAIQAIAQENVLLQELEVAYEAKLEAQQEIADFMKNNMVDAFDTIFDKTKSAEEKFKSFAKSVVDQLMKIVVTQQLVGSFDVKSGSGNGIMGVLGGALFGGFRQAGGSVSSDRSYVVGERGPELFSPPSNGTITSNANMNNLASSKQQVEIIIQGPEGFNIETVRSEIDVQIRQAAPKIIRTSVGATQKAMKHGPKGAFGL